MTRLLCLSLLVMGCATLPTRHEAPDVVVPDVVVPEVVVPEVVVPEGASVTVETDEAGELTGGYLENGTPIPLRQLEAMMLGAQSPNIDLTYRWMKGGMWVLPQSIAAQAVSANKVTRMLGVSGTIDFTSTALGKIESSGITLTGAQVGDPCQVGVPAAAGALKAQYTCYVSAADTVKVVFESIDTSAGTITLSTGSGTAAVSASSICACTDTTANASVKCAVATTVLTATGTGSDVIAYICSAPVDPASGTFFVRTISSQ